MKTLRWTPLTVVFLLWVVSLPSGLRAADTDTIDGPLSLWPPAARNELLRFLAAREDRGAGTYAVFDADNTLWRGDLEEALLLYLEQKGRIRPAGIDPHCHRPLPLLEGETVFSYYSRIEALDPKIGWPWIAQAFSGMSLAELRTHVREMISSKARMRARVGPEGGSVEIDPPAVYPAQVQLVRALMAEGIEVYVVTAALEELVRMVVSDPEYGLGIPPENVIGVNLLIRGEDGSIACGARERTAGRKGTDWYFGAGRMRGVLTGYLYTPASWYAGKLAAIKEYIHPDRRPILVAGDAPNDHFMLFYCDVEAGGVRLFVRRKEASWQATQEAIRLRAMGKGYRKADPLPERGWLFVTPEDLLAGR